MYGGAERWGVKRDAARRVGEKISTPQQNHGNGCWGQGKLSQGVFDSGEAIGIVIFNEFGIFGVRIMGVGCQREYDFIEGYRTRGA